MSTNKIDLGFIEYEFPNKELYISFLLFILTVILGTCLMFTGSLLLIIPTAGSLLLSMMFGIAGSCIL